MTMAHSHFEFISDTRGQVKFDEGQHFIETNAKIIFKTLLFTGDVQIEWIF
jgi:hypothetical protein